MNNRMRTRMKALDMRIRSESNGEMNLKLLCVFGGAALRDFRNLSYSHEQTCNSSFYPVYPNNNRDQKEET